MGNIGSPCGHYLGVTWTSSRRGKLFGGCYLVGLERNRVYTARSGFPAVRGKPRRRPILIADETPQQPQALFFRRHSMQLKEKEIVLAHEPDAAWIIALWKAIHGGDPAPEAVAAGVIASDRKSTRLNSSHLVISYAVFCLKKKQQTHFALARGTVPGCCHRADRSQDDT